MDDFRYAASHVGNMCPFYDCWENDHKSNEVRRAARQVARARLKMADRNWENEYE